MDEELAWAAGLLDGDGTLACNAGRYLHVSIGSTDEGLVRRFNDAVGVGNVTGPYDRSGSGRWSRKPQYFYQAFAKGPIAVKLLLPLLGDAKRAQLNKVLGRLQAPHDRAIVRALFDPHDNGLAEPFPRRVLLAWAAGFFDAEGCFSFNEKTGMCVSITNTDRLQLARFQHIVGIGQIYGPYGLKAQDAYERKAHYFIRVQGHESVQALAAILWFKLGSAKKAQARGVLARVRTACRRGHPKVPGHDGCAECTRAYWQARRDAKRNTTAEPAAHYKIA